MLKALDLPVHRHLYCVQLCTEKLMTEFMDIECPKTSHTITRWLLLYPSLSEMLEMYKDLQSCFTSIDKPPFLLNCFFKILLSELYLRQK